MATRNGFPDRPALSGRNQSGRLDRPHHTDPARTGLHVSRVRWELWLTLFAVVVLAGCSRADSPNSAAASRAATGPFKTAKYAQVVPIPEGVRHRETLVGPSHDLGGAPQMDAVVWVFRHDRPVDELAEYYRGRFPSAKVDQFDLDGPATELTIRPANAQRGEEVVVTIRAGELQVRETIALQPLERLAVDAPEHGDTFRR